MSFTAASGNSSVIRTLNAGGFFASAEKPKLNRNQFGGKPRWADSARPFLLLHRLRRFPASQFVSPVRHASERTAAPGHPRCPSGRHPTPAGLLERRHPIECNQPIRTAGPGCSAACHEQQSPPIITRHWFAVTEYRDKGDAKLDHIFGDKFRGFLRYSQSRADIFDPGTIPGDRWRRR